MHNVYLNEYNFVMENQAYLPLVSGLLHGYAKTSPLVQKNYRFMPYLFYKDTPQNILERYTEPPSIAAFSALMWNEQLSLAVAKLVKEKYSNCLIVFGGPQVPHQPQKYFEKYPFIDVTVKSDGEEPFLDILTRFLKSRDFRGIANVGFRDEKTGDYIINSESRSFNKDLDMYPSPYLEGLYDDLMQHYKNYSFHAVIETNRGCPFPCTFCFWGQGGLSQKYRFFGLERVQQVLEWCGKNKIEYVFNADSNFGMLNRDLEVANFIVEAKKKYGYPQKFRTCFGKNADDKVFKIGKLLYENNLEKGVTLARQSNDPETLKNIRRENIKLSTYRNLQAKFNDDVNKIPVYAEFIIGLPGETYESWMSGLEEFLQTSLNNQIYIYLCQILPNTEMDHPEYRKKFNLETIHIPFNELHSYVQLNEPVQEKEEIIVSTCSMSVTTWKQLVIVSWVLQLFHGLKIANFIMVYLAHTHHVKYTDFLNYVISEKESSKNIKIFPEILKWYESHLEALLAGNHRAVIQPKFGNIYWDIEEASFFKIVGMKEAFYCEFLELVKEFLMSLNISFNHQEVEEVIKYQNILVSSYNEKPQEEYAFSFNIPEYFSGYFNANPIEIKKIPQILKLKNPKFFQDKKEFAREVVWFGRRSGAALHHSEWHLV